MGAKKALAGVSVFKLSGFVAGSYCAKLLADLGAEVVEIEQPGVGDETRRRGPFRHDSYHPECSALHLFLNANKLSITLDTKKAAGRRILGELLNEADVLVLEDMPRGIGELRLDRDTLRAAYPQLVTAAITPFGLSGPYKDYKSYYLNTFECGGEGYFLPSDKAYDFYSDRQPIRMGGFTSEYNIGVAAAAAVLACLVQREALGFGEFIEISKQEVLLNLVRSLLSTYNIGVSTSRATRTWPVGGLMLCQDGWILLLPLNERLWEGLIEAMGNPAWAKEERFQYSYVAGTYLRPDLYTSDLYQAQNQVNEYLQQWCSQFTKQELSRIIQAAGSSAGPVNNVDEVVDSEQLRWRNFFVEVDHPEAGRLKYPGVPYKMSETPGSIDSGAPLLGEHNELIYCQRLGYSKEQLVRLRQGGII